MSGSYRVLAVCIAGSLLPQMFIIRFIMDPYGDWNRFSFYPHSVEDPNHFVYGLLQTILMTVGVFSATGYDITCLHVFILLSAQIQFLQESLEVICNRNEKHNGCRPTDCCDGERIESALNDWVKSHHRTLKWAHDITNYFAWDASNKFFLVGTYSCLTAFSIPIYLKSGNFVDLGVICFFAMGSFAMQFYLTKMADDIYSASERLVSIAYGGSWFSHPLGTQKTLLIISYYTMNSPIRFRAFKLVTDNVNAFLQVLLIAYRCLSVIVQMNDEEPDN